jgi:hypothetical protein
MGACLGIGDKVKVSFKHESLHDVVATVKR